MVKLEELSEEHLASLPDEVKNAIKAGKDELISARGVIGNLNKKLKTGESTGEEISDEQFEALAQKREMKKSIDSFISSNPIFSDFKKDLDKYMETGVFKDVNEASQQLLKNNETLRNNFKTNQSGLGGTSGASQKSFTEKVSLDDFKNMTTGEQDSYKKYCNDNFGGIMYKLPAKDE